MLVSSRYGDFKIVSSDDLISKSLLEYGEWAQLEIDLLSKFIQKNDSVIDAGAFIGTHTRAFSEFVGKYGKVYAFEPNPQIFSILSDNCKLSPLHNIELYQTALGRSSYRTEFLSNYHTNFGSSRLSSRNGGTVGAISVKKLDDFNLNGIAFVKADVEGLEFDVILGAERIVEECRPIFFLEANSIQGASSILPWGLQKKYRAYGVISGAFNPRNFKSSAENIFNSAKECGILLIPSEVVEKFAPVIRKFNLPELEDLDSLVLLLLHKPQYPHEFLSATAVSERLGLDYPSPGLDKASGRIAALNQTVVDREAQIASRNRDIVERDGLIGKLSQLVIERERQIGRLEQQAVERERQLANSRDELAERQQKIHNLSMAITERDGQIVALVRSRSWRLTRPLQSIGRLARRTPAVIAWRFLSSAQSGIDRHVRHFGVLGFARRVPYYIGNYRRYIPLLVDRSRAVSSGKVRLDTPPPISHDIRLHPDLCEIENSLDAHVSVVIPTLNAGPEFDFLLRKLKGQRGIREIEIVIVDSGSRDGTVERARSIGCTIVEIAPQDFSHSHARNTGAASAHGNYLIFMVQDAYPIGNYWLYGLLKYLFDHISDKVVAVSCCEYSRSDSDIMYDSMINTHYRFLNCLDHDRIGEYRGADHMTLRSFGQLSDISCLIRRDVFDRYRYRGDYAEDLDLGIRLIKDDHRIAMLASVKTVHSHNRSAYYYLKRSFVDVIFLVGMFDDFTYPPIESVSGLISGITSTAAHLSQWLTSIDQSSSERVLHEELESWIRTWRHSFVRLRLDEQARLGDLRLERYLDSLSERYLPDGEFRDEINCGAEAQHFLDNFFARLEHVNSYIRDVYGTQDAYLREQLKDAVRKTFAATVGSALGFFYMDCRQGDQSYRHMAETIKIELKAGI